MTSTPSGDDSRATSPAPFPAADAPERGHSAGTDQVPASFPVSTADLASLHARFEDQAHQAGLVEVGYRTVDSPIGPLLLAVTEQGLVRVAFQREDFEAVLQTLGARIGPRILRSSPHRATGSSNGIASGLASAARQVEEYFTGARRRFDLPLDRRLSQGFRGQVQRWLPQIHYGRTLTYRQVAEEVGNPAAVRAVGSACATNPLPVVVPCHRVLRSDGGLGGYVGGLEAKTALLELERAGD